MANLNPNTNAMIAARRKGKPALKAEYALRKALKDGGLTECGAYKLMVQAWNECIQKALDGNMEALKLLVERLDGKPKQQIEANVNVNHAFEQALIAGRQRVLSHSSAVIPDNSKESEIIDVTVEHEVSDKV